MFSIFKEVSKRVASCTWLDIFHFREMYPGTVEQAINSLVSLSCYPSEYCADCMYSYTHFRQPGCHKCHEMAVSKPTAILVPMNGCRHYCPSTPRHCSSNRILFANDRYNHVPTAKLIDIDDPFDANLHYGRKASYERWSPNEPHCSSYKEPYGSSDSSSFLDEETIRKYEKDSRKWDNRLNSRRSWEYVYKGLESSETEEQNYNRPSPGNQKSRTASSPTPANGVTETLGRLRLGEAAERAVLFDDEVDSREQGPQQPAFFDNSQFSKKPNSLEKIRSKRFSPRLADTEYDEGAETPKWECSKCTYYNRIGGDVCEMCGKSKNVTGEVPLISGGKHCSRCTLVNKKEATQCEACEANLEGSPTYV